MPSPFPEPREPLQPAEWEWALKRIRGVAHPSRPVAE
jgi:hypothetical protein